METRCAIYLSFIWLLLTISCEQKSTLETYINNLPPSLVVSYHIQDKEGEVLASHNSEKQIPSASIIKIPILVELMRQVDAGTINLEQEIVLKEENVVGGAGELQFNPIGTSYTVERLAREMIRISDNVATNLLIELVGMASVQSWLTENGYNLTQISRKMMDFEAIAAGKQNYTSPKEMSTLLANLYSGKYLSEQSTSFIIALLLDCADNSTIPSKLPAELPVAHKTGTLEYVRGDAGIILGENVLILAVFVEGFDDLAEAELVIGDIAKMAWERFQGSFSQFGE
jgi:beta-lactamase class A